MCRLVPWYHLPGSAIQPIRVAARRRSRCGHGPRRVLGDRSPGRQGGDLVQDRRPEFPRQLVAHFRVDHKPCAWERGGGRPTGLDVDCAVLVAAQNQGGIRTAGRASCRLPDALTAARCGKRLPRRVALIAAAPDVMSSSSSIGLREWREPLQGLGRPGRIREPQSERSSAIRWPNGAMRWQ